MKWLVTVHTDASLPEVSKHLHDLGVVDVDINAAVPMSDNEVAIPVDGPKELQRLAKGDKLILGVWENSDIILA
jgi:hypothetical protein